MVDQFIAIGREREMLYTLLTLLTYFPYNAVIQHGRPGIAIAIERVRLGSFLSLSIAIT